MVIPNLHRPLNTKTGEGMNGKSRGSKGSSTKAKTKKSKPVTTGGNGTGKKSRKLDTKAVEKSILYYTNRERRKEGLPSLDGDKSLISAARNHSRWMADTGYFDHVGAKHSDPTDRVQKAGYSGVAGENIWHMQSYNGKGLSYRESHRWGDPQTLGKVAVRVWMKSPGHRKNLLNSEWDDIGIGVAVNKKGMIYLTQNFGYETSLGSSVNGTHGTGCLVVLVAMVTTLGSAAYLL